MRRRRPRGRWAPWWRRVESPGATTRDGQLALPRVGQMGAGIEGAWQRAGTEPAEHGHHVIVDDERRLVAGRQRGRRRQHVPRRRAAIGWQRQTERVLVGVTVRPTAEHHHPSPRRVVSGDVEEPRLWLLAGRLDERPRRRGVEIVERPTPRGDTCSSSTPIRRRGPDGRPPGRRRAMRPNAGSGTPARTWHRPRSRCRCSDRDARGHRGRPPDECPRTTTPPRRSGRGPSNGHRGRSGRGR